MLVLIIINLSIKKMPEEPIEPSQLIYNATSYIEPTNEYMDSLIVASFISKKDLDNGGVAIGDSRLIGRRNSMKN